MLAHQQNSGKTLAPIPEDLRSYLRSGVVITSFSQAVEELVLNAIDAEATCIAVRIDLEMLKIEVIDNGTGLSYDDLTKIGSRHVTSKLANLEDINNLAFHGFKGEAIASLRQICSILQITSRSHVNYQDETFVAAFVRGKRKCVEKASRPRQACGTTVIVNGFFYNVPVRRKTMNAIFEIEDVRNVVYAIALSHPRVSFTLRDENSGEKLIQTYPTENVKDAFLHLNEGFQNDGSFVEIKQGLENWQLSGFILDKGLHVKGKQYVFVNQRYIRRSWLNKAISRLLQDSMILRSTSSPRKSSQLYPVFVLFLKCPFKELDMVFEPRKTSVEFQNKDKIMDFICSSIKSTLAAKGLLKIDSKEELTSSPKIPESTIDGVARLRSASSMSFDRKFSIDDMMGTRKSLPVTRKSSLNLCQGSLTSLSSSETTSLKSEVFEQAKAKALSDATELSFEELKEGCDVMKALCFSDYPISRIKFANDEQQTEGDTTSSSASGKFSFKASRSSGESDIDTTIAALQTDTTISTEDEDEMKLRRSSSKRSLDFEKKANKRSKHKENEENPDEKKIKRPSKKPWPLPKGTTPYIKRQRVRLDSKDKPDDDTTARLLRSNTMFHVEDNEQIESINWSDGNHPKISHCVSKEELNEAKVIGQVDNKFIAILSKAGLLMLLDQHAVHERIRLEHLLEDHFANQTVKLGDTKDALQIEIDNNTKDILSQYQNKLRKLGLAIEAFDEGYISMTKVPACFLQRESSEKFWNRESPLKSLMHQLVKEVVQTLSETRGGGLGLLPTTIANVLKSKACRSAIMFGDPLTSDECQKMIADLQKCKIPFQCAHGRPSVAPIIHLDQLHIRETSRPPKLNFRQIPYDLMSF